MKKKKVLWIDDYVCYPVNSGYKVVVHQSLINYRKYFDITYISRAKKQEEKLNAEAYLANLGIKPKIIVFNNNLIDKFIKFLSFIFSKYPLNSIIRFKRKILAAIVRNLYDKDLIFLEGIYLAKYAYKFIDNVERNQRIILRLHNNDAQRRKDIYIKNKNIKNYIYASKLESMQNRVLNDSRIISAVLSNDDFPDRNDIKYVPPPLEATNNGNKSVVSQYNYKIVFVASFKNEANDDALKFLYEKIWPIVQVKYKQYKCYVYGRDSEVFSDFNDEKINFFIKGTFENIEDVYTDAFCAIIPLRIGSGIKLKVLEAISHGVPVITTSVGLQGLPFKDGESILIADTPDKFLTKFEYLIEDELIRNILINKSKEVFIDNFNCKKQIEKINSIIQGT